MKRYFVLIVLIIIMGTDVFAQSDLRRAVERDGYAWVTSYPDDFSVFDTDGLIAKSSFIIRGRVVNERTRLTPDESYVLTDYTIEVLEVFKDITGQLKPGSEVVVTKPGGNVLLDGKPVRVESRGFPPCPG